LISLEADEAVARYRLLNSTRTYALEKMRSKAELTTAGPGLRQRQSPELPQVDSV